MTATHWTTANLRDRNGIVKRTGKEKAKGEREGSVIEKEGLSRRTSRCRSPSSSPLCRDVRLRPEDSPLGLWCCRPRALSPGHKPQSEMPSAVLWPCSALPHAPVQAPSKYTYRSTLYQLRSHFQKCTVCHGK